MEFCPEMTMNSASALVQVKIEPVSEETETELTLSIGVPRHRSDKSLNLNETVSPYASENFQFSIKNEPSSENLEACQESIMNYPVNADSLKTSTNKTVSSQSSVCTEPAVKDPSQCNCSLQVTSSFQLESCEEDLQGSMGAWSSILEFKREPVIKSETVSTDPSSSCPIHTVSVDEIPFPQPIQGEVSSERLFGQTIVEAKMRELIVDEMRKEKLSRLVHKTRVSSWSIDPHDDGETSSSSLGEIPTECYSDDVHLDSEVTLLQKFRNIFFLPNGHERKTVRGEMRVEEDAISNPYYNVGEQIIGYKSGQVECPFCGKHLAKRWLNRHQLHCSKLLSQDKAEKNRGRKNRALRQSKHVQDTGAEVDTSNDSSHSSEERFIRYKTRGTKIQMKCPFCGKLFQKTSNHECPKLQFSALGTSSLKKLQTLFKSKSTEATSVVTEHCQIKSTDVNTDIPCAGNNTLNDSSVGDIPTDGEHVNLKVTSQHVSSAPLDTDEEEKDSCSKGDVPTDGQHVDLEVTSQQVPHVSSTPLDTDDRQGAPRKRSHYCILCERLASNFPCHLRCLHALEEGVRNIFSLPRGPDRKRLRGEFREEGNAVYNASCSPSEPIKRYKTESKERLVECPLCSQLLAKQYLWRHKCPKLPSQGRLGKSAEYNKLRALQQRKRYSEASQGVPKERNFCIFCKQLVLHFSHHLENNHSPEERVKNIFCLPFGQERKQLIAELRREGNVVYNESYSPRERTSANKTVSTDRQVECPLCSKLLSPPHLYRHRCPKLQFQELGKSAEYKKIKALLRKDKVKSKVTE